tara:strand:- start:415 stop:861 length:447 start_codon:yes stop_codon:yes gene_type:complete
MLVLYGSQKGNAKAVAEEIFDRIDTENKIILSLNESLNLFENISSLKNQTIIIITSTTGNGDIPVNGYKWWKFVKNRKLNKNYLENIQYYLLALGDSNYDDFCGAGKKIFKRFKELNAIPLNDLITIDDVDDDYEEKIDIFSNLINNI